MVVLCTVSFASFGQQEVFIQKGMWLAGGNFSLSTSGEDFKPSYILASPSAGYFLGNKLATGIGLTYQNNIGSYKSFTAGLNVRYYIKRTQFAPFTEFFFGGGKSKTQWDDNGQTVVDYNTTVVGHVGVGLDYFLTKNVALEGILKYNRYNDLEDQNLNFGLGFQIFLGRKCE